jgi:hypothetical protein
MKYIFIPAILLVFAACKQKVLSGAELENKLIETMQDYLDHTPHAGVAFKVKDVTYYAEKKEKKYICNFHVSMRTNTTDTTGLMSAVIPNDFSSVERRQ